MPFEIEMVSLNDHRLLFFRDSEGDFLYLVQGQIPLIHQLLEV